MPYKPLDNGGYNALAILLVQAAIHFKSNYYLQVYERIAPSDSPLRLHALAGIYDWQ